MLQNLLKNCDAGSLCVQLFDAQLSQLSQLALVP